MSGSNILDQLREAGRNMNALAVSFYDYETTLSFSYQGDRFFHAASTIKVAVLMAVFKAAEQGALKLDAWLHVRNRFRSVVDGSIYKIDRSSDGDSTVYKQVGRALRIVDLARAMITRSSNLATNLLLDFVGVETVQKMITECALTDVKVHRGVEDNLAYQQGISNELTADGLVRLFRIVQSGDYFTEGSRQGMIDILLAQEFNSMIPAGLPNEAKIAHKTGEISSVCHDAGLVFLPGRQPYALAILTEPHANSHGRQKAVAAVSQMIYKYITGGEKEGA